MIGCTVNSSKITAVVDRCGGIIGKLGVNAYNISGILNVNNNTVYESTISCTSSTGSACGIVGQLFGDCDKFSISENYIDSTITAASISPFGLIRVGASTAAFGNALAANLLDNY